MKFIIRLLTVVALLVPTCSLSVAGPQAQPQAESKIITFDAPGGGTASGQGTVPRSISPIGEITGEYYDSHQAVHGFVRAADGTIATLDVPGASTAIGQGTFPKSINPSGEIAGFYYDASHVVTRGFVRDRNGVITTFDGALPMSITPAARPQEQTPVIMASYETATERSLHLTLVPSVPSHRASTRAARSQVTTQIWALWLMASCGTTTVISRLSTWVSTTPPFLQASTRRA